MRMLFAGELRASGARRSPGFSKVARLFFSSGFLEFAAFVLAYFIAINLVSALAFSVDKRRAVRGEWRISESTLLAIVMLGGSPGAVVAQHILRHKTRKEPFRSHLRLIAMVHGLALLSLYLLLLFG